MKKLLYQPNTLLEGMTIFDKLLDDMFTNNQYYPTTYPNNVKEDDDAIELSLDVPGFNKSEINLNYENDQLQITAKKDENATNRSTIQKAFSIPNISIKKSTANLENGVLTIRLEKSNASKKQQLKIS